MSRPKEGGNVYIEPRLPRLKDGQTKMPVKALPNEDADECKARVSAYAWAKRIVSGPHRTGMSSWVFVLGPAT